MKKEHFSTLPTNTHSRETNTITVTMKRGEVANCVLICNISVFTTNCETLPFLDILSILHQTMITAFDYIQFLNRNQNFKLHCFHLITQECTTFAVQIRITYAGSFQIASANIHAVRARILQANQSRIWPQIKF